jgi:branched-chain amino acid aminotransferase
MRVDVDHTFAPDPARREDILARELGFGRFFTDRMLTIRFTEERGWHDARIGPFADLTLSPAAAVLHYGQAIFEGMKAYRRTDGEIGLFRPEMNARRMARSAVRMVMPPLPEDLFLSGLDQLIDLERDWVPSRVNEALYVRPFSIATEPLQGVRAAKEYLFAVILSPVGAYYASGFEPVKILVADDLVRAVKGGTGEAKFAGNYAASLLGGVRAREAGCAQVLWLDGAEHRFVEEIGAMNVMFVIDGTLVTSPLSGSILPGVTRDTVLTLAREEGIPVEERPVAIDDVLTAIRDGRVSEAFGCGTAAVITAIRSLTWKGEEHRVANAPGELSKRFFTTITDVQFGRAADRHGWVRVVPRRPTGAVV